tara:strand:- start:2276 stop:2578 length:303 start_codon:yes stop_codon:yes gene_type:complete
MFSVNASIAVSTVVHFNGCKDFEIFAYSENAFAIKCNLLVNNGSIAGEQKAFLPAQKHIALTVVSHFKAIVLLAREYSVFIRFSSAPTVRGLFRPADSDT